MLQKEEEVFWYEHLSCKEEDALHNFETHLRANNLILPDYGDKFTLLRYLKARNWDITKASHMYQEMAKFRHEKKVDEIYLHAKYTQQEMQKIQEVYPHCFHKTDMFGRPVYYESMGRCDASQLLTLLPPDKFLEYRIFSWERLEREYFPACSSAVNKTIITAIVVLDMSGVSLKQFTSSTFKMITIVTKMEQDCYPEHLGQMFIINAPYLFKTLWSWVGHMLDDRTKRKIAILGTNYQDALKEVIPLENLPLAYGGTSECIATENAGPWNTSTCHKE